MSSTPFLASCVHSLQQTTVRRAKKVALFDAVSIRGPFFAAKGLFLDFAATFRCGLQGSSCQDNLSTRGTFLATYNCPGGSISHTTGIVIISGISFPAYFAVPIPSLLCV